MGLFEFNNLPFKLLDKITAFALEHFDLPFKLFYFGLVSFFVFGSCDFNISDSSCPACSVYFVAVERNPFFMYSFYSFRVFFIPFCLSVCPAFFAAWAVLPRALWTPWRKLIKALCAILQQVYLIVLGIWRQSYAQYYTLFPAINLSIFRLKEVFVCFPFR